MGRVSRRALAAAGAVAVATALAGVTAAGDRGRAEAQSPASGAARLNMVFILDGLRPDSINAQDAPNLLRLRDEGVSYQNSHSAVPTVTRLNSSVIGSGSYPTRTGITGNSMFVPAVNPTAAFSTGEADNLYRLDEVSGGRMLFVKTLGERLQAKGLKLAAVGSGSSGGTLLLNPRAPRGVGVMVNAGDVTSTRPFAFPAEVGEEITRRFGPPPSGAGEPNANSKVDYTEQVLRDYVLPELKPDVVLNWLTEPDGTQHATGAGSPQSIATIRNDDRQIGLVLERLRELGLYERTNIFVISDHGFSLHDYNVNITQELIDAGLKASPTSDDVVVANSGTSLISVKDRDPAKIRAIARFLQGETWADTLFTAARRPRDGEYVVDRGKRGDVRPEGWVPGTFSLELVHHANPERGADLIVTYPWTSKRNAFGVRGTSGNSGGGATGPLSGPASGHGSFSPWDIRNTFLAWGADFKDGVTARTPAGNVDLAPTILALAGVDDGLTSDGRVLAEAFADEELDEEKIDIETRTYRTEAGGGDYRAAVRVSEVDDGRYRYVDKSWRLPAQR